MSDDTAISQAYITKDGSLIKELAHPLTHPGLSMSLAEARVDAGGATERHFHAASDEIYYCLEGAGVLYVSDSPSPFSPGMWRLIPKGASHYVTATTPLRFLCICSPPYAHEDTILSTL